MIYPNALKKGDTIATTAMSDGITDPNKLKRIDNAIDQIKEMGYEFLETSNTRTSYKGRSSSAKERAEQFTELWQNEKVKSIIMITGGDFLLETLEQLDFEELKKYPPKWVKGYSDITGITFLLTTILDIATIYSENLPSYGAKPIFQSELDAIELMKGNQIRQFSFEKFENEWADYEKNPFAEKKLTEKVEWKNLNHESKIHFKGRSIGGCFDVIRYLIGTKFDHVKQYIQKYQEDGIIWFLEIFDMDTTTLFLNLWQMRNSGYFENCKGIIFGRSLFLRETNGIDFETTIKDAIGDLNIPVIYDADFGHRAPQMSIVSGAVIEVESENGRGYIDTYFKP